MQAYYLARLSFFFKRKDNKLRLIFDTRVPNAYFKEPPAVSLASGDALSELELDGETTTYIDGSDVEVCFYQHEIPEWIREYFGVPSIEASFLPAGLRRAWRRRGEQGDEVCFRVRVCPMGWSWAVSLAQKAHEWLLRGVGKPFPWVLDKVPYPPLFTVGTVKVLCIDDFAVLGSSP